MVGTVVGRGFYVATDWRSKGVFNLQVVLSKSFYSGRMFTDTFATISCNYVHHSFHFISMASYQRLSLSQLQKPLEINTFWSLNRQT